MVLSKNRILILKYYNINALKKPYNLILWKCVILIILNKKKKNYKKTKIDYEYVCCTLNITYYMYKHIFVIQIYSFIFIL